MRQAFEQTDQQIDSLEAHVCVVSGLFDFGVMLLCQLQQWLMVIMLVITTFTEEIKIEGIRAPPVI
jgi:hypothetical protein